MPLITALSGIKSKSCNPYFAYLRAFQACHSEIRPIMSTQPTILVLGATGKVGAKIAQILAQSGDVKIVAGVRSPNNL
jgi:NADPH:quinone reductase-like Zn-dependent oxidoreductase